MPLKEFTFRRIRGVTDLRLSDDPALRKEICRSMAAYAPLLDEQGKAEPTFDSLKGTREALEFLSSPEGSGCVVRLQVLGRKGTILEKSVLFMDGHDSVRAASRWTPEGGIVFVKTN